MDEDRSNRPYRPHHFRVETVVKKGGAESVIINTITIIIIILFIV